MSDDLYRQLYAFELKRYKLASIVDPESIAELETKKMLPFVEQVKGERGTLGQPLTEDEHIQASLSSSTADIRRSQAKLRAKLETEPDGLRREMLQLLLTNSEAMDAMSASRPERPEDWDDQKEQRRLEEMTDKTVADFQAMTKRILEERDNG